MTSNINFIGIDEDFPIAGQDNDTQTFRDNFNTIKTSLQSAKEEITELQDTSARLDLNNDFQGNILTNAVIQYVTDKKFDAGTVESGRYTVDFENGGYQIIRINTNTEIDFLSFPNDDTVVPSVGKVTVELYSDGSNRTITFASSGGTVFYKDAGFPASLVIGSDSLPTLIEVWQHSSDKIFLRYLGQFAS